MPYDLFPEIEREATARASTNLGVGDPSAFTGFVGGTGSYAMRSFADTARAIDLAGSVVPIALDKLTGGTARQDQYFAEHDDTFNNAVDYWTPKPGEVGAAGQIVGSLVGSLPLVIANPAAAVAATQLSVGEDLTRQGVNPYVAAGVGTIQGAGFATALRVPFLGKSLVSRVTSGAGGMATIGAAGAEGSKLLLQATGNEKEAEQFNPWDPTQRSLDLLMGAAFGGIAHLDARAQAAHRDMIDQQTKDAILTLNQAKHLESVALAGKADTPFELNQGVKAVQTALNQLVRGEPVNVEQITQGLKVTADPARTDWNIRASEEMGRQAKAIVADAVLQNETLRAAQETPGFQRTPDQLIALRKGQPAAEGPPEVARAIEIANKPGFQRTAEEKLFLDNALAGKAFDHLLTPVERSQAVDLNAQAQRTADLEARIADLTTNRTQTIADTAKDLQATQGLKAREAKKQAETIYQAKLDELNGQKAQRPQEPAQAAQPAEAPADTTQAQKNAPDASSQAAAPSDPVVETAKTIAGERPDMLVPTGEVDAQGNPVSMSAKDYMAHAAETARLTQADAGLFKTAITCLLGML